MSEEKEKPVYPARSTESERDVRGHPAPFTESTRDVRSHPETTFLPPLKMVLAFLDRDKKERQSSQEVSDEKNVEKLSEKDE